MRIIFSVTFNVESSSRATYRRFIEDLCSRVGATHGIVLFHGHSILPRLQERPTDFFELVLQTNHPRQVRLLFRPDNLHLVAYQMENSDTWLEFSMGDHQGLLIPGSSILPLDGSYGSSRGLEKKGDPKRSRSQISLGQDCLRDAVNNLAVSNHLRTRANSLLVVIQMTSESMRFETITDFIVYVYHPHKDRSRTPDKRLLELENSWGRISNALLRYDAHPDLNIFPLRYEQGGEIFLTAFEASHSVRFILRNIKHVDKPKGHRLLEIFYIDISVDGEYTGNIYGKVTVNDGHMSQNIYEQERNTAKLIRLSKGVVLTGPVRQSFSALDNFTINVALRDALHQNHEISTGEITWNIYDPENIRGTYDNIPQVKKIYGTKISSSASVAYAVLSNAVQATVEVMMINGDGEDPADVYGFIVARNTHENFEKYGSMLFNVTKESGKSLEVSPGELIPLSRSVVAVPLDSCLVISADLYNRSWFEGDPVAEGNVSFHAELSGTAEGYLAADKGHFRVKVTWAP